MLATKLLKWVCGFANAQGGKIYIGIDDDMSDTWRYASASVAGGDIPNKIVTMLGIVPSVSHIERGGKELIKIGIGMQESSLMIYLLKSSWASIPLSPAIRKWQKHSIAPASSRHG